MALSIYDVCVRTRSINPNAASSPVVLVDPPLFGSANPRFTDFIAPGTRNGHPRPLCLLTFQLLFLLTFFRLLFLV